jgi:hypothetical protein
VEPPVRTVFAGTIDVSEAALTTIAAVLETEPSVAVAVTLVSAATTPVVIRTSPDVAPAAIEMVAGTGSAVLSVDVSATEMPPAGATEPRFAVKRTCLPPMTFAALDTSVESAGELMVSVAVLLDAPSVAVMTGETTLATAVVETVNVVDVAPCATVTVAGSVAAALLDANVTTLPPAGAGPVSVTVPVDVAPPATDVGFSVTLLTARVVLRRKLSIWVRHWLLVATVIPTTQKRPSSDGSESIPK